MNKKEKQLTGLAFLIGCAFIKDKNTQTKTFKKGLNLLLNPEEINTVIDKSEISEEDKKNLRDNVIEDIDFEEIKD